MKHKTFFLTLLFLGGCISGYYLYRFWQVFPAGSVHIAWDGRTIALLTLAIMLQLVGHYLRAYKWRLMLEVIRPTKVRTLFKGVAVGFLYNSILPFRIGEFLRADLVGRAMSISRTVVFGTILAERLVDGIILLALCATLLLIKPALAGGTGIGFTLALLGVALAFVALLLSLVYAQNKWLLRLVRTTTILLNDQLRDKLRFIAWSAIYGLRLIFTNSRIGLYVLLSVVMWVFYLGSTIAIILALAHVAGLDALLYSGTVSYVSVAIPSGPAYLGTYLYFFTSFAGHLVTPVSGLYAASIASWFVMTVPISVIGVVLLAMDRRADRAPSESDRQNSLRNKLFRDYDVSKELSHFLDAYFTGAELSHALSSAEMAGRVKLLRTFKGGSNAITMLAWGAEEARVRKMTLPQHAEKLKAQHDWLKERSDIPHLPKVVGEDHTPGQYSFDIAFHAEYKPFFDYIHSQGDAENNSVIERVVKFMHEYIYQPSAPKNPRENVRNYIENKVLGKLADTVALSTSVATLSDQPTIVVNGETYDNWQVIVPKILGHKQAMKDLSSYQEGPIHGDLTIDNIIVNPDNGDFIVLDPNDENQVSAAVVDMAKLYQSLHSGYEFLCNLERVDVRGNSIRFEEHVSSRYTKLLASLDGYLKQELDPAEYRSILFHEAVHYCRMLTYRAKINPETLPAFYGVAVRLFNEFMRQYE